MKYSKGSRVEPFECMVHRSGNLHSVSLSFSLCSAALHLYLCLYLWLKLYFYLYLHLHLSAWSVSEILHSCQTVGLPFSLCSALQTSNCICICSRAYICICNCICILVYGRCLGFCTHSVTLPFSFSALLCKHPFVFVFVFVFSFVLECMAGVWDFALKSVSGSTFLSLLSSANLLSYFMLTVFHAHCACCASCNIYTVYYQHCAVFA